MRSTISYLNREKIDTKQAEVKNLIGSNIEFDVEIKCIEKRTTQVIIAEDIDTTKSYIICIINKQDGVLN